VRRPTEDDLWLLAGYVVWFALIFGLWQLVTHLPRFRPPDAG
jgi:hypothetical protein